MAGAWVGGWVVMAGLLAQAPTGEAANKAELARFEGSWRYDSMEMNGKAFPLVGFEDARLICKGNDFTSKELKETHVGTFSVDVSKKPKTIDITFKDGSDAGKVFKGIYELEGDTYKVCMGFPGKDRPTAFATKPGSECVLEVLKRVKP